MDQFQTARWISFAPPGSPPPAPEKPRADCEALIPAEARSKFLADTTLTKDEAEVCRFASAAGEHQVTVRFECAAPPRDLSSRAEYLSRNPPEAPIGTMTLSTLDSEGNCIVIVQSAQAVDPERAMGLIDAITDGMTKAVITNP